MAELYPVTSPTPKGLSRGAVTQAHQTYAFPAPTHGVDARQSFAASNPQTAITIENMFARTYGLELRAGYTQWSYLPTDVKSVTLMPFVGKSYADSRLFAAASDGQVYDVTTENIATPATAVLNVLGQTTPGEAYWVNFVTEADNYLCVVFPGAGYQTYDSTNGWVGHPVGTAPGDINGVNPTTFAYVFAWENRLWFVEGGTANGWFLDTKLLAGDASLFNFGPMFTRGGELSVGASWTIDGGGDGGGMADSLVLISSEGDVLIYGGEDPTDATKFHINGRWYVGRVPAGRRYISRYGANMALISERGLLLMSEVLRGDGNDPQKEAASRVNQLIQPAVRTSLNGKYWELKMLTDVNALAVNTPSSFTTVAPGQTGPGTYKRNYELNSLIASKTTRSYIWTFDLTGFGASQMTNFPFNNIEMFESHTYATDEVGNIWRLWTGDADGTKGGVVGTDIEANVQTAFVPLGDPTNWKRFIMARAGFRATNAPGVSIRLNSDWAFADPPLAPVYTPDSVSVWASAEWDTGVWAGTINTYKAWAGISGMGHYASFTMRVNGAPGTIFTDWDCVVESGGIL